MGPEAGAGGSEPARAGSGMPREPALDGIRGLAVAAVLAFHGGFGWARGGYLGVSTFFTLSGFLITRLLLRDQADRGRPSLGPFWARRVRRLGPASLLTLLTVVVLGRTAFRPFDVQGLTGDVLAALGQVANWRFVAEGRSYTDLFRAPSLVQHLWSLAVEEQLYVVVPLVVVACRRARRPRRALALAVGALAVASMAATVALAPHASPDRIYYGTDTRAFELLAGAALALLAVPERLPRRGPAVQVAGWVGLGLSVLAWATVAQHEEAVTHGGLWAYALVSVALIVGARAAGPLRTALSWPPLVQLGAISYGVYLFHWPLFQVLTAERLGTDRTVAFGLAVALTFALALLSHQLLEVPILAGRVRALGTGRRPALAAIGAVAVVALAAVLLPPGEPDLDLERAQDELAALLAAPDVAHDPGAPKVAVVGDSTGLAVNLGLAVWSTKTGDIEVVRGATPLGCGLIVTGRRAYLGGEGPIDPSCDRRTLELQGLPDDLDVVVFMAGGWEVAAYRASTADDLRTIEDPGLYAEMAEELEDVHRLATAGGATFAFVLVPDLEAGVLQGRSPREVAAESDPARIARYNRLGRDLAARHPDTVALIDLRRFMATLPGGPLDRDVRPDGLHLSQESAVLVAEEFLAAEILEIATTGR